MRVDPDRPTGPVHLAEPSERAERDRMVTAEHKRDECVSRRLGNELGDVPTRLLDLRQEAGVLVDDGSRLGHSRAHVSAIDVLVAELGNARGKAGVPNRRRTHVNAAAPGAEVERGADNGNFALRLHVHGGQG